MQPFAIIALLLILARAIAELWLSRLNQRHVRAHANELPPAFRGIIDEATYRRSVDYTLAKSRFADITGVFDVVVLIALLFSGVLPWAFGRFTASFGRSIWAMAGFLFFIGIALSMLALPFDWYAAIQTGRAIRFQHRDDQDVGARYVFLHEADGPHFAGTLIVPSYGKLQPNPGRLKPLTRSQQALLEVYCGID